MKKYWSKGTIRIAFCGLENQTSADADMPLRVISYDGSAYRAQLLSDKNQKNNPPSRYPVITLVLYFGYEKHWNKPISLSERLTIPDKLKPYVNDYRINLFQIAYLTEEQVNMFQSDFRLVADYFVQMRKNNDYKPSPQTITHVQEFLQLMSVMTQDNRYEEVYNKSMEGVSVNMCEVLDRVEQRGLERGREEERKHNIATCYSLCMDLNMDEETAIHTICQKFNITEMTLKKILDEAIS